MKIRSYVASTSETPAAPCALVGTPKLKVVCVEPAYPEDVRADLAPVDKFVSDLADDPNAIIRVLDTNELPDVVLLVDGDQIYLRRSADLLDVDFGYVGVESDLERFPPETFGPFALESGPQSKLADALRTVAKAINLRRVTMSETEALSGYEDARAVKIQLQLERWNDGRQRYEVVDAMRPVEAYDGERLRVSVSNEGFSDVDLTILSIDSSFRIRSYFPTAAQAAGAPIIAFRRAGRRPWRTFPSTAALSDCRM